MIVARARWFLIIGPDIYDNDWGVSFGYGPRPSDGISDAWRCVWRINVRWPISLRRSGQRRGVFREDRAIKAARPIR